jgi:hypothetical protein
MAVAELATGPFDKFDGWMFISVNGPLERLE